MVRTERVEHVQCRGVARVRQRLGRAAPSLYGIPGRLHLDKREAAVFVDREARYRVVTAVGGEQEALVRRKDHAACALERVWRALLAADWLERPRAATASGDAVDLLEGAVSGSAIVQDEVPDLVRLHVQMSDLTTWSRHPRPLRNILSTLHAHLSRHGAPPLPEGGLEGVRQLRYRFHATELLCVSSPACRAATDRTGPTSCPSSRRLRCGSRHIGSPVPPRRPCRTATGGGRR